MKNLKQFISFIPALFILFTVSTYSQTLQELLEQGDKYYEQFDNEKALDVYKKADKMYPANWEVIWRMSRAYVDIGEHMPNSTDKQEEDQIKTYEKALALADSAVKLEPKKSLSYLRRAIANGRIALFKGVFSVAGVVNKTRNDLYKALKLNNGGDEIQAITNYVLARTHGKVSEKWSVARAALGLGWAELDSAWIYYDKAFKLDDKLMMMYVDHAKLLIDDDQFEKAKAQLDKALKCQIRDEDDKIRIEEVKELLKKIKEELD
ncbi:MAG: hypothetical protein A2068_11580 [Ignavibacteria bacterium GWB2_35_6b]|nr:MAG: hypothetical protein A2068_11580 [Ignavibacteria bacterium GWB2_35_6b]